MLVFTFIIFSFFQGGNIASRERIQIQHTVILIPAGDASTHPNILITPGILPLPILHTQSIWNPPGLVQTILSLVIPWSVGGLPQYIYTTHSSHIHGTLYWNRIFEKLLLFNNIFQSYFFIFFKFKNSAFCYKTQLSLIYVFDLSCNTILLSNISIQNQTRGFPSSFSVTL